MQRHGGHGAAATQGTACSEGLRETGNRAFDEYRADALRKLEEEANEFRAFLERLRMARDRAEFDEYMKERRNRPATEGPRIASAALIGFQVSGFRARKAPQLLKPAPQVCPRS